MSRGQAARMPLVAGNWKLHNNHLEAISLTQKLAFTLTSKDFAATEVAVLPPFTALRSVQTLVSADKLQLGYGAQDISSHDEGAYTGEVSGPMLAKLGCRYALAGHSERRRYHHEDDALVSEKVRAALRAGIVPILCVGETLEMRASGEHVEHTHRAARRLAERGHARAGRGRNCRLRAGLGDWHGRGGHARGRAADVRRHPRPPFRRSRASSGQCAYPLRGVGEGRQHGCDYGAARH